MKKLGLIIISLVFFGLTFINIFAPAPDVLISERRQRTAFPKLSLNTIAKGEFMTGFETWASDSFVFGTPFAIYTPDLS